MSKPEFKIESYSFCEKGVNELQDNHYAKNLWPVVYLLIGNEEGNKKAYIGESSNVIFRMNKHLVDDEKGKLDNFYIISSDKFHKSAALDMESSLIRYLAADGQFDLLNSNIGIANHNYYQKNEIYKSMFLEIWEELRLKGIAKSLISDLKNSDLFKYSPYKQLSSEQEKGVINILRCLVDTEHNTVIAEGGAGTGKTILAIYLFKLLLSDEPIYKDETEDSSTSILKSLVDRFKQQYPNPKIALVIPILPLRYTLKKAFRNIRGLNPKMVMSPSEAVKEKLDLIVVDESHRLRRRVNLGAYFGGFDKTCESLGLDKHTCSELDWVHLQSHKQVLFYDEMQSIKPSDVKDEDFYNLKKSPQTTITELKSQFRSRGGNQYAEFVDDLLSINLDKGTVYRHINYELILYESLEEMEAIVCARDIHYGLSKIIAGYAWAWVSKNDKNSFDIEEDGVGFRWNSMLNDWIDEKQSKAEVGSIHCVQGYDLNYTGIIFGPEISYDPITKELVVIEENYFDKNGKLSIKDPEELKSYIINIYKTMLLRSIRGTYLYVCDPELRKYLSHHIPVKLAQK